MPNHGHLVVIPDAAAAEQFARILAARPLEGGCPQLAEPIPGLTAALESWWALICVELHALVADTTFEIWCAPLRLHHLGDVEVRIAAPPMIASWVRDRFDRVLATAVERAIGEPRRIVVEICETCTPRQGARS